jgi:hypothetical protein
MGDDIELFVKSEVSRKISNGSFKMRNGMLGQTVVENLVKKAQGM